MLQPSFILWVVMFWLNLMLAWRYRMAGELLALADDFQILRAVSETVLVSFDC